MYISRVVVRNFRSFKHLDVPLNAGATCVIGENNTGKSNLLHAVRLCIDASLSSAFRTLLPNDLYVGLDISEPSQVLIGLEINDFKGKVNEEALVGSWQHKSGLARLIYRFRPKLGVREDLESGEIAAGELTRADYQWEIAGGGDPAKDMAEIEWDEDVGSSIRFSDLQSFLVVFLPALRDVENDLKQYRNSPLSRLIDAMEIDDAEQEKLLDALRDANKLISASPSIKKVAEAIDTSLKSVTGPAYSLDVALGLAEPTFQAIIRALRILLSNKAMENFDPSSNGLGLNNILYVAILIEYFKKRQAQKKTAGQIILFEEPEAHLHPQLQLNLFEALNVLPFQTVVTTHSTHITAHAELKSYVTLTQTAGPATAATVPVNSPTLEQNDIRDLERYLDATRSSLLFARKVMLVEGPAELFLIPAILKQVKNIDLDREGITVVPIFGVHFSPYAKLFSEGGLPKRCAIVADGDLKPSDADASIGYEDEFPEPPDLDALTSDFVRVFKNKTTFERAIALSGNIRMFAETTKELGASKVSARLFEIAATLAFGEFSEPQKTELNNEVRTRVLASAKRFGKARFAQVATRHIEHATEVPKYLVDAVDWLNEE